MSNKTCLVPVTCNNGHKQCVCQRDTWDFPNHMEDPHNRVSFRLGILKCMCHPLSANKGHTVGGEGIRHTLITSSHKASKGFAAERETQSANLEVPNN